MSEKIQYMTSNDDRVCKCSLVFTFRKEESKVKFHLEENDDERQWLFCQVSGCSFWTAKVSRMERHKLCHTFEPSPLENKRFYKCPDCHLKFFSLAKLLKHDRRKHTGVKDYECRICGAEVTDIQTHMRVINISTSPYLTKVSNLLLDGEG